MKSNRIINAYNKIVLGEAAEMRILDNVTKKQSKKLPVFKIASVAAIICLVIIGFLTINPFGTNQFTIKCYAMDTENGQSAMRPIDGEGMVSSDIWFGYYELKEETICFYIDVGWQIDGENIEEAEITVDDGYFLNKLGKYEFEQIGNSVILEKKDIHNGDMLYVGYERPVSYVEKEITYTGENAATGETWEGTKMETVPEYETIDTIIIHAVVTYENGKTEEKDIVFDMERGAVYENMAENQIISDMENEAVNEVGAR